MTWRGHWAFGVGGLVLAALAGCESEGAAQATPDATDGYPDASPETVWSAAGTTKMPAFGTTCRLAVDEVLTLPGTGAADDTLTLDAPASGAATATLKVKSDGQTFEAQLDLARGLADKSFRQATGSATLGASTFTVVDGTLCVAERLTTGAPVPGELSLILALPGGGHRSVAGTFTLPGAAVAVTEAGTTVTATAIDIDLR